MPMISVPVPETTESVTRPVMLDVVRQLMALTGVSKKTNIVYFGDLERSKQLNSAIAAELADDPNTFAHNDKISIEVSETFNSDRVFNDQVLKPDNLLVFQDEPLAVIMKPAYSTMDAVISIKYRSKDENAAIKWRNYVKSRISQRRELYLHNVTYSFGIPDECLYILKEIHRLRENVAGYGEDFDTYFANNRTPKMTLLTNMNGSAKLWAVPETQTRVQGWFDWELPEKANRDGEGGTYTVSFNYKFTYSRPDEIEMIYPIMVHNQMLDQRFRDTPMKDHNDYERTAAMTTRIFKSFEGALWSEKDYDDFGYSIPDYDEFWPLMVPLNTRRLLTVLFDLDPANPKQFLNLGQLGERKIDPDVLEYIRSERNYVTRPNASAINVAYYKKNLLITPAQVPIVVDRDLNVIGQYEPDFRVQHHIRIGLQLNLGSLPADAIIRMQDHGRAIIQILLAIDPTLKARGFLPVLIDDNFVAKTSLLIAIQNLRPVPYAHKAGAGMSFTVQSLIVQT